ncbi:unnamed protein product [Arabidopsis lyrata]|uniref:F-box associated beta-propeller type 3 domain-containing protein n=1 Tax=Arabidopsis lyrata subsp. lyrata TaxID=81972 RepID=D7LI76_ARALL|nr:hypothetical protein ARALYDRAFT_900980 [Arabidopsis lyrata subsp. lyrata]CAH8263369.1 unnamed protein product [Arabidopsis lyrata]
MKFSKGRNPYTSSYANGLIYFSSMRISKEEKYDDVHMICNPSTGQYVILPELRSYRQAGSFLGFDPIDKQFKVLVMACVYDDHHILTLGTGKMSWRKIQCPLSHERLGEAKCFNGAVFYLARKTDDWSCGIVCFDVRSEKFMFIDAKHFGVSLHTQLINYKGKLGGISLKYACDGGFPLELCMWVLEDVEKRKWLKYVYTLQADNNLVKVKNNLFVVGTTATGEIVLSKDKGSIIINTIKPFYVFYFNPEKNTLLSVEIQDLGNAMDSAGSTFLWESPTNKVHLNPTVIIENETETTKNIWPWKRKSSDKATTEKPVVGNESTPVCSLSYLASPENQHLEGVKKIAKLEAECQSLRGLLRKKLPGPAAMAQMKLARI